jgi:uncharacterized protein YkwD
MTVAKDTKVWTCLAALGVVAIALIGGMLFNLVTDQSRKTQAVSVSQQSEEIVQPELDPAAIYLEVNRMRQEVGVPALSYSQKLIESAQLKCDDMVKDDYYGHENPNTNKRGASYVFDVAPGTGYASENLNNGRFPSSESVVSDAKFGWTGSPAHKAAMLDPKWTDTGIAVCRIPSQWHERVIVQHLATLK